MFFIVNGYEDYSYVCPIDANYRLDNSNIWLVGNLQFDTDLSGINKNLIYFLGKNGGYDGTKRLFVLIDQGSGNFGISNIPMGVTANNPLIQIGNQAIANLDLKITISPNHSNIAYFATIDAPSTSLVIALYNRISDLIYNFSYFTLNTLINNSNNSIQFTDNSNLFYISYVNNI